MASLSSMLKRLKKKRLCPGGKQSRMMTGKSCFSLPNKPSRSGNFWRKAFRNSCDQVFDGFSDPEIRGARTDAEKDPGESFKIRKKSVTGRIIFYREKKFYNSSNSISGTPFYDHRPDRFGSHHGNTCCPLSLP